MLRKPELLIIITLLLLPANIFAEIVNSLRNPFLFGDSNQICKQIREVSETKDFDVRIAELISGLELNKNSNDLYWGYAITGLVNLEKEAKESALKSLNNSVLFLQKNSDPELNAGRLAAQIHYALGTIYIDNREYSKAQAHLNISLNELNTFKAQEFVCEVLCQMGRLHFLQKDYNKALSIFSDAVLKAKKYNNQFMVATCTMNKGIVYEMKGEYDDALSYFILTQNKFKELNNSEGHCSSIKKVADVFYDLKDYDQALNLYFQCIDKCRSPKSQKNLTECYLKVASIYINRLKLDEAYDFINKYVSIKENKSDTIGIIKGKICQGTYYARKNNFHRALILYHDAIHMLEENSDISLEGKVLIAISDLYVKSNDLMQAKSYAQKALVISSTLDEKEMKVSCFRIFSDLYESMGDYRSALFYKNKYTSLKDSLLNVQTIAALRKYAGEGELNKHRKVIEELEQENLSLNYYWLKEKNKKVLLLVSTLLLLVFTIVLLLLFRAKNKAQKDLKLKNKELERLNATKDKFFSIIAHDLKSPFNSLMGFSEMLSLHAESKSHVDILESSKIIHNSTRKLYSLVDTLLQWSRTQLGTTEYKPEKLEVGIVSSNIVSILKINAEEKDIVISVDIDRSIVAWADKDLYSAVLRNLISNAIKFSRVGSVITVTAVVKKQFVEIAVRDTGVGITKENLDKIFNVDSNISTKGTFNEKGTGLGLVLCKEFVEINKGTIWAESQLEKGSTFKFTIPLTK